MATLIDSYSETNQSADYHIDSAETLKCGQVFHGVTDKLGSAKFYLKKSGSPTGNAVFTLYAVTGIFGLTAVPTGSALGTSATFDVSTLTTSYQLINLTFSGAQQYNMSSGTDYWIGIEYSGGDASNRVDLGHDNTAPTHPGDLAILYSDLNYYAYASGVDACCFYVYTADAVSAGGGILTTRSNYWGDL